MATSTPGGPRGVRMNLDPVPASELMTASPPSVRALATVPEASALLTSRGLRAAPVILARRAQLLKLLLQPPHVRLLILGVLQRQMRLTLPGQRLVELALALLDRRADRGLKRQRIALGTKRLPPLFELPGRRF